MSTSGLSTSVTPPPSLRVSTSGSALAPGSRGPMTHAAEHDDRAGDERRRQRRSTAGCGPRPSSVRGAWREAGPQQGGGEEPGGDERQRQARSGGVGAERGDEHEQHGAGHERLAAGVGAERERVAGEDDERRADRRPAAPNRRRRRPARRRRGTGRATSDRSAEATSHVSAVGKSAANVVRVVEPGDRPHQRERR